MKEDPDTLVPRVADFFRKHNLASPGEHILAAVSGGPDSTALVDLLLSLQEQLKIAKISVAHFDHGLRGAESASDAAFVREMAESRGLAYLCGSGDVRGYATGRKVSVEMAARACRHHFFSGALAELGAGKLALGHTADDQAEEVLLRLFRGTGPAGLRAMLPASPGGTIRPLLFATRAEVLSYLRRRGLPWREDPSNREPFCQRNALRLEIMPLIRKHFHEDLAGTLSRYASLAADEESYWSPIVDDALRAVAAGESAGRVALSIGRLLEYPPAVVRRVLRRAIERVKGHLFGVHAVHIESVLNLAAGGKSGKRTGIPGGIEARIAGGNLAVGLASEHEAPGWSGLLSEPMPGPGVYDLPGFDLRICLEDSDVPAEEDTLRSGAGLVWLDPQKLAWPLHVRYWRKGDRFRPAGGAGSRKLQDFFTDLKVDADERRRVPLLCDAEKICWVVGHRLDGRAEITRDSKSALKVQAEATT